MKGLVADTNSSESYAAAALADTDSDGFANWQEYITDCDPNRSSSFFRITGADSALSWHSATGRVYEVLHADSLFNTFTNSASFEHPPNSFIATPGFYRVKVRLKD